MRRAIGVGILCVTLVACSPKSRASSNTAPRVAAPQSQHAKTPEAPGGVGVPTTDLAVDVAEFIVVSAGADGVLDTADDLVSRRELSAAWGTVSLAPGFDGVLGTVDDEIADAQVTRTAADRSAEFRQGSSAWRTAAGPEVEYRLWAPHGGNAITFSSPGADGRWATGDDAVAVETARHTGWPCDTFVERRQPSPGPNGLWGDDDDTGPADYEYSCWPDEQTFVVLRDGQLWVSQTSGTVGAHYSLPISGPGETPPNREALRSLVQLAVTAATERGTVETEARNGCSVQRGFAADGTLRYESSYCEDGHAFRSALSWIGDDGQWGTADDVRQWWLSSGQVVIDPGVDGVVGTTDDRYEATSRQVTETTGLLGRRFVARYAGGDGFFGTLDDDVSYYDEMVTGDTRTRLERGPGADALWLTADDPVTKVLETRYDGAGRLVLERSSLDAGADGVYFSLDDPATYETDIVYGRYRFVEGSPLSGYDSHCESVTQIAHLTGRIQAFRIARQPTTEAAVPAIVSVLATLDAVLQLPVPIAP